MTQDFDNEIWLPVVGYEGLYEVSNMARVRSINRTVYHGLYGDRKMNGKLLSPAYNKLHKTFSFSLSKGGVETTFTIHILVARAFIPNPEGKREVNHKGGKIGVIEDNFVENLEWNTPSENIKHSYDKLNRKAPWTGKFGKDHHRSKLVECETVGKIFHGATEAARELGLGRTCVERVCRGERKHTRGYKFKYI